MTETLHTDVLVIGAGLAGICASIQAARLGLDVVLAEKSPVLGGNSGPEAGSAAVREGLRYRGVGGRSVADGTGCQGKLS